MKRESESQHANETAASIWFAVEKQSIPFDTAVDNTRNDGICPPIAFAEGVELAKDWLES